MKNKIIRKFWPLLLIIISAFLIVFFTAVNDLESLLETNFMYGGIGALLTLSLSLYIHTNSSIIKHKSKLEKNKDSKLNKIIKQQFMIINKLHKEIKDDLILTSFNLLFIFLTFSFKKINIPGVVWPFAGLWSKMNFINFLNLVILFLSFYAFYDLLKTLILVNQTNYIN